MSAANLDFTNSDADLQGPPLEVNATFSFQLVWQVENIPDSGDFTPVNLAGYTAKMQVRKSAGSPLIIELSTVNGRITFDAPNGIINLLVPASVTATLPAGMFRYDLFLTDAAGFETKFIEGLFEIVGAITSNG